MQENILPFDGEIYYYPNFFDDQSSRKYFAELKNEIPWQQKSIKIFGKSVNEPRLTAFYGDESKVYTYSGLKLTPLSWTSNLASIKEKIETKIQHKFNVVLLNYYRDGKDGMGWHRDNERELGSEPIIASVSFGASRNFCLRNFFDKKIKKSLILESGSLLVMKGKSQQYWEHSIPKITKCDERINLTFRFII